MSKLKPVRGAQLNLCHPLARGLVGCWLFNTGTGNMVFDYSRNGNIGTINGPLWVPGNDGAALEFNQATSDFVNIPDSPSLQLANGFTFVSEVMPHNPAPGGLLDSGDAVLGKTLSATVNNIDMEWLWTAAVKPTVLWFGATQLNFGGSDTYPTANIWNHMAATYNKTDVNYYLQGLPDGGFTPAEPPPDTGFDLKIGTLDDRSTALSFDFDGLIKYLFIYNRALSAGEILQLRLNPYRMFEQRTSPGIFGLSLVSPSISPSASPSISPSVSPSLSPSSSPSESPSPSASESVSPSASPSLPPTFIENLFRDKVKNLTLYAQVKNITNHAQIGNNTDYPQIKCIG